MTKARATGDPSIYARADRVLSTALRRDPRNLAALVGAGSLAGLRHDFREQLRLGLEAGRVRRPGAAVRRHRRCADRARPVPRRRSFDSAAGGPQAGPSGIRARVLLPRADEATRRVPCVRCASPHPQAAPPRASRTCRRWPATSSLSLGTHALPGCLPRLASNRARLLGRAGGTRACGRGARRRSIWPPRACAAWPAHRPPARALAFLAELELAAWPSAGCAPSTSGRPGRSSRVTAPAAACRTPRPCSSRRTTEAPSERCVSAAGCGPQSRASAPPMRSAGHSHERGRPRDGLVWARRALRTHSREPMLRAHAGLTALRTGRAQPNWRGAAGKT